MAKSKKILKPKTKISYEDMTSTPNLRNSLDSLLPKINKIYDGINLTITTYDQAGIQQTVEENGVLPHKALEILAAQGAFKPGTLAAYLHTQEGLPQSRNQEHQIIAIIKQNQQTLYKIEIGYTKEP